MLFRVVKKPKVKPIGLKVLGGIGLKMRSLVNFCGKLLGSTYMSKMSTIFWWRKYLKS